MEYFLNSFYITMGIAAGAFVVLCGFALLGLIVKIKEKK